MIFFIIGVSEGPRFGLQNFYSNIALLSSAAGSLHDVIVTPNTIKTVKIAAPIHLCASVFFTFFFIKLHSNQLMVPDTICVYFFLGELGEKFFS